MLKNVLPKVKSEQFSPGRAVHFLSLKVNTVFSKVREFTQAKTSLYGDNRFKPRKVINMVSLLGLQF